MRCDMVVAVGPSTVDGHTLFGHNCAVPFPHRVTLFRTRGRDYAVGEIVRTQFLELSQVRHTCTVLAAQPEGCWGYVHGLNEHGLSVGLAPLAARLASPGPGLLGTDLVRLALERCRSAQQAVDLLTDLLQRYGRATQALPPFLAEHDPAFLLADPAEAFALESAGGYWVEQEVCEVRAVSEVRVVHQDWDRIAPGFAGLAIERAWWPADGTKLDFAVRLGETNPGLGSGWRRWGRATLLLEQQNGHIDAPYLRRVLSDHYEETPAEVDPRRAAGQVPLCQHALANGYTGTAASLVAQAPSAERLALAWWAFGPPCGSIWFPILLEGEMPEELRRLGPRSAADRLARLTERLREFPEEQVSSQEELARLQASLDQDAEEFVSEGTVLKSRGELVDLGRLATAFMQHAVERFEVTMDSLLPAPQPVAAGAW